MTGCPLVSLRAVSLSYDPREGGPAEALSGIDLTLPAGSWLTVLGANGAGKSSLIRIIAGVVRPSAGEVSWGGGGGRPVCGVLLADPDPQLVAQTVEEEVAFGLENLNLPPEEIGRRLGRALERLGILHLRAKETGRLSGGEKQLVLLAALLAMEPALLLLDEPSMMLDHASWRRVAGGLAEANRSGTAVVLACSDPDHALEGGETALLESGRLRAGTDRAPWRPSDAELEAAGLSPPLGPGAAALLAPGGRADCCAPPPSGEAVVALHGVPCLPPGSGEGRPVDLALRRGEILLLTGPAGAGKTTLARMAAGVAAPPAGRVELFGGGVGLAFQFPEDQFLKEHVGEEAMIDCPDEGRLEEEFEALGLSWGSLRDRTLISLSTGQRRMVALAGILAASRALIILDEPTAGLDGRHRGLLAARLAKRRRSGGGTVVIGHDLRTFLPITDRVVAMEGGAILYDGPPAGFLGLPLPWIPDALRWREAPRLE